MCRRYDFKLSQNHEIGEMQVHAGSSWCARIFFWSEKHFDASRRTILIGDNTIQPISLNPLVFQIILRILDPNNDLKFPEVDQFIINHGGTKILLPYFTSYLHQLLATSPQLIFPNMSCSFSLVHLG